MPSHWEYFQLTSLDRADWATFTLKVTIIPTMIEGNIDTAVAVVTGIIIKAADIAILKFSGQSEKHSRPWWNEKCHVAKKRTESVGEFL